MDKETKMFFDREGYIMEVEDIITYEDQKTIIIRRIVFLLNNIFKKYAAKEKDDLYNKITLLEYEKKDLQYKLVITVTFFVVVYSVTFIILFWLNKTKRYEHSIKQK